MKREPETLTGLQHEIGITFHDLSLLRQALTHASYLNENPEFAGTDNERLEFLGDAICDFLAAEYLCQRFPEWQEGQLTALRAQLVRSETLAGFAREINLGYHLLLGRGEELRGGRTRMTMLEDAFEALLGALYLDQGLAVTRQFFLSFVASKLRERPKDMVLRDAKTCLQEWAQARYHVTPYYVTVEEAGPDHAKRFTVEVLIRDRVHGRGVGNSKQAAEQAAAQVALETTLTQDD